MNYRVTALFDCIPLDCFWETKKREFFLCWFMAKMVPEVVPVVSFCRFGKKKSTLKKLDCGSNKSFGFICLCERWIYGEMGWFVYWNVKYYLFCRKLCQSQRETWLPVVVFFLLSLFCKIAFCMSSLLFDCYLNGLSVCLVLVVDLLLTTLKCFFYDYLATSPLSPKWMNTYPFFLLRVFCVCWWSQVFSVFCHLLLSRANGKFSRSLDRSLETPLLSDKYLAFWKHFKFKGKKFLNFLFFFATSLSPSTQET